MTIGVPKVTYNAIPGQNPTVDISCYVDTVTTKHGRDDTDNQPDAGSCTVELSANYALDPPLPAIDIGAHLRVSETVAGKFFERWGGYVTDINQGWDDAGEDTPNRGVMQVVATGKLAQYGRRVVGDTPWPKESDGTRVTKIINATGLGAFQIDPGTVQILARDVDSQPALDLIQQVATDAGGIFWEMRGGQICYADAEHRRGTVPAIELDACDVLVTPTWQRNTAGLINSVSIGYGVVPEGGEQTRFVDSRPDSIAKWGTYGYTAETQLAAAADAAAMGGMILARNSSPVWLMTALPVDIKRLSDDDTKILLGLDVHDLILVTGLPSAGNLPATAYLWIEGWEEKYAWGEHELTMAVSGYCRTVPPPRWDDIAAENLWDSIGLITWDDATCLGPIPPIGRWTDVPASTRWNTVPASQTWDTWTG